jgi:hypothetical protein
MTRACWAAGADGRYWIDIALGSLPCQVMLDTGLIDPQGRVAFEVDPSVYDALEQSGQLLAAGRRQRSDSSGRRVWLPAGFVAARLIEPATGAQIGPPVPCLAVRTFPACPAGWASSSSTA